MTKRPGLAKLLALSGFGAVWSLSSAQTAYHLMWSPAVGEIHRYKITLKMDYGDGVLEFNSNLQIKVLKIAPTGDYSVLTKTSDAYIQSGDSKKVLADQAPVIGTYAKTGLPKGDSLNDREADPFSDLLQHLTEFESPSRGIKLGESWNNHPTGPKSSFFGEPRVSYQLVDIYAEGPHHLARIRYVASAGTDPEAALGNLILDRQNNHLTEMQASIPHFRPEGASEEAAVTISVKEIPLIPPKTTS